MSVTPGSFSAQKPTNPSSATPNNSRTGTTIPPTGHTSISLSNASHGRPTSSHMPIAGQQIAASPGNRTSSGMIAVAPLSAAKRSIYGSSRIAVTGPSVQTSSASPSSNIYNAPISSTPLSSGMQNSGNGQVGQIGGYVPSNRSSGMPHPTTPTTIPSSSHSVAAKHDTVSKVVEKAKTSLQVPKPASSHLISDAQWAEMNFSEAINFSDFSMLAPTGSMASSGRASISASNASSSGSGASFGPTNATVPQKAPTTVPNIPSIFEIVDTPSQSLRPNAQAAQPPAHSISNAINAQALVQSANTTQTRQSSVPAPTSRTAPLLPPSTASPTSSFIAVAAPKQTPSLLTAQSATKKSPSPPPVQANSTIFPDEMDVDYEALYLAAVAEADAFKRKAETEKTALVQAMATQEHTMKTMKEDEAKYRQETEAWKKSQQQQPETTVLPNVLPRGAPSVADPHSAPSAASKQLQDQLEMARLELERKTRDIERLKSQLVSAHMEGIMSADGDVQETHIGTLSVVSPHMADTTPTNTKKRDFDSISKKSSPGLHTPSHPTSTRATTPPSSLSSTTIKARKLFEERSAKKRKLAESFPFLNQEDSANVLENSFIATQDLIMTAETPATERAKFVGSLCHLDSTSLSLVGGQHALQFVSQMVSDPQGPLIWLQSHQSRFISTDSVQLAFYELQSTVAAFQSKKEGILMKLQSFLSHQMPMDQTDDSNSDVGSNPSPYRPFGRERHSNDAKSSRMSIEEHERLLISGLILQLIFATSSFVYHLVNSIHQREVPFDDQGEAYEGIQTSSTGAGGGFERSAAKAPESTPSLTSTARISNLSAQAQASAGNIASHASRLSTATVANSAGAPASQLRSLPPKSASSPSIQNHAPNSSAMSGSIGPSTANNGARFNFPNSAAPISSTPTGSSATLQHPLLLITEDDMAAITNALWLLTALVSSDPIARALALLPPPLPSSSIPPDRKTLSPASKRESNVMTMLRNIILSHTTSTSLAASQMSSNPSIIQFLAAEIDLLVFSVPLNADTSNSSSQSSSGLPSHGPLHLTPSNTMNPVPNTMRGSQKAFRHPPNATSQNFGPISSTALPTTFTGPSSTMAPPMTPHPMGAPVPLSVSREPTKLLVPSHFRLSNASSSALILLESAINLFTALVSDADVILSATNATIDKLSSPTPLSPHAYLKSILLQVHTNDHGSTTSNGSLALEEGKYSAFKSISSFFDSEAFTQSLSPYSKGTASNNATQSHPLYILPQIANASWKLLQQFSVHLGGHPSFQINLDTIIRNSKQLLISDPSMFDGMDSTVLEERRFEWLIGNPTLSGFSRAPTAYQPSLPNIMDHQVQQMDTKLLMVRCMQTFAAHKRIIFQKALVATSSHHFNTNIPSNTSKNPPTANSTHQTHVSAAHANISKSSHRWENPFPQSSEMPGNADNNEPIDEGASIDLGSQLATSLVISVSKTIENMVKMSLLYDTLEHSIGSEWNGGSNLKVDFWNHPLPITGPGAPSSSLIGDKSVTLSSFFNNKGSNDTLARIEDGDGMVFGKSAICDHTAVSATSHTTQYPLLINMLNFVLEACDLTLLIMRNVPKCAIILRSSEPELWTSFRTLDSLHTISNRFQSTSSQLTTMSSGQNESLIQIASSASTFVDFSKLKLSQCSSHLNSILENLVSLQDHPLR